MKQTCLSIWFLKPLPGFQKHKNGIQGDNEAGFGLIDLAVIANLNILNFDPVTKGKFTWIPEGKRGYQNSSTLDYVLHDTDIGIVSCKIDEGRKLGLDSDHVLIKWEFMTEINVKSKDNENKVFWNDFSQADWGAYNSLVEYNLMTPGGEQSTYDRLHAAIQTAGIEIIGKKQPQKVRVKPETGQL